MSCAESVYARFTRVWLVIALGMAAAACGGGGGLTGSATPTQPIAAAAANVATAVVNAGPLSTANQNTLYTSVTVCAPGSTTNCQTIDGIEIDTGSSGLRIYASALSSALAQALPLVAAGGAGVLVECAQFADGFTWGPVATADMTIAGEKAASLPMQIVADSRYQTVPAACTSVGTNFDTPSSFGANGALGVSVFAQDCGPGCQSSNLNNPGFYYACPTPAQCAETSGAVQVLNPVTLFATDNNGVIIQLPAIPAGGSSSVTGALIFGVDTETNNASGTATVLGVDPVYGYLSTTLNGGVYAQSFLDSGSNALYFDDASLTQCADQADSGFYCPSNTANLSASITGANNASRTVKFSVANAASLGAANAALVAFDDLAGTFSTPGSFDWGLPFFYGRNVYTVLENKATAVGTGPYVAF